MSSVQRAEWMESAPAVAMLPLQLPAPFILNRDAVVGLQRAVGNQVVGRLLASRAAAAPAETGGPPLHRAVDFTKLDTLLKDNVQAQQAQRSPPPGLAAFLNEVEAYRATAGSLAKGAHVDPAAVESLYAIVPALLKLVRAAHDWEKVPAVFERATREIWDQAHDDLVNLTGFRAFTAVERFLGFTDGDAETANSRVRIALGNAQDPLQGLNFLRALWKGKPALLAVLDRNTEKSGPAGVGVEPAPAPAEDDLYVVWVDERAKSKEPLYPSAFPERTGDMPLPTFGGWFSYMITEVKKKDTQVAYLKRVLVPVNEKEMRPRPLGTATQAKILEDLWGEGFTAMKKVDFAKLMEERKYVPAPELGDAGAGGEKKEAPSLAEKAGMFAPDAPGLGPIRYSYFFRGDTRDAKTIVAHGGTKPRADVPTMVRETGMDQPWNPLADPKTREQVFFRSVKDDNCLVTAVSIARSLVDASKFPLLSTLKARKDPALVKEGGKWTHTTQIYLVRVNEGFDTAGMQAAGGNEQYGLGEYATRFIAPEHHLAALAVKRIFNGEDENDGHVAQIVQATNLMGNFPQATYTLPDEVKTFVAKPPATLTYSAKQPVAVKEIAVGEGVGEEKQKAIEGGQVSGTKPNLLKAVINVARGLGVLVLDGPTGPVRMIDPTAAEPRPVLQSWASEQDLLSAMLTTAALEGTVRDLVNRAGIAQEAKAAVKEEVKLSAEALEAKNLLQKLALSKKTVKLPGIAGQKTVVIDEDGYCKIGLQQRKLDEFADLAVRQKWVDALKAAA